MSSIPYTILRSTQFFEFVGRIAQESADGKSLRVAAAFIQPIVSDDVVAELADVAVGAPVNGTLEVAGPDRFHLDDLVRRALTASGDSRNVITDAKARYFGALLDEETLTSEAPAVLGTLHFADWLSRSASRPPTQTAAAR